MIATSSLITADEVARTLRQRLPALSEPTAIDPDAPLADMALDSMDTVELLCLIDQQFEVRLSTSEYASCRSINDFFQLIADKANH